MILDTYMYLDYKEAEEGASLKEIIESLEGHPDYGGGGIHAGEYTVLKEAVKNEEVGNLSVCCQSANMGYDKGTAACTFKSQDESSVYVVYRGTGDGEWPDNGIGMTRAVTIQQSHALAYFEEVVETININKNQRLIVTGHSKGGNKAQYVTMETKYSDLVDICYSVDGQGFSEEAVTEWKKKYDKEAYRERREKLQGICGENDYVSVLGISIIPQEHIRYIETPVEKSNFAGYHDIKYMFAALSFDGSRGGYVTTFGGRKNKDVGGRGALGEYAAALSAGMMKLPADKRDGCAAVIMQLMEASSGSKKGMNGEKLTMMDIKDFAFQGIPLISDSLLKEDEGRGLLEWFGRKEMLSGQHLGRMVLQVKIPKLLEGAYKWKETADQIEKMMAEAGKIAESVPLYMKGAPSYYHRIKLSAGRGKELAQNMLKIAQFQEEAVRSYKIWDSSELKNDCYE